MLIPIGVTLIQVFGGQVPLAVQVSGGGGSVLASGRLVVPPEPPPPGPPPGLPGVPPRPPPRPPPPPPAPPPAPTTASLVNTPRAHPPSAARTTKANVRLALTA